MKINTRTPITMLDGSPIKLDNGNVFTLGDAVSLILINDPDPSKTWRPLKALAVAQRFYKEETVDLDDGDIGSLRQIIENNESRTKLVLGRILQILNESKEEKSK